MERGRIAVVFALATLCSPACAPDAGGRVRWVELDLVVGPDGTRVVTSARTSDADPPVDGPTLTWTLVGPRRQVLASGEIADTREARFEDLAGGGAHDVVPSDVGVVTVRIPQTEGTLVLRDASGLVVGQLEVTASDQRVSSLALLASGDVLGAPVQVGGGSASDALDILFLPEGYTETELPRFHEDVERVAAQLAAQPDYALFWEHIRVWRRDVRSRQSGAGTAGVAIDTAFDVAFGHAGTDRCAWFATSEGRAAAERLRRDSRADAVAILVNSSTYGGCAQGGLSVNAVTSPAETAQVVAHELGHAFFGLADEYDTPAAHLDDCAGGLDHAEINVSDSATDLPWADLVAGSGGAIGAFEGAHYCAHGRYRPTHDCLMRSLYARMCPVCLRHMARVLGVPVPGGHGTGTMPGSDPPAEEPPTDDPPAEDPPADEPPADEPPTDPAISLGPTASIVDTRQDASSVEVTFERVAGAREYWVYALAMTGASTWAAYSVETVGDPGAGATVRARLSLGDLCADAGPGSYGLVVQAMAAEDEASASSVWLAPVGDLLCE